mgnify:CR=1 FL=1
MKKQYSQHGFDLVALEEFGQGYFVEAGATNGINLSNSYLLELNGWDGICCEPNPNYQEALSRNRSCNIEKKCLYDKSGKTLEFAAGGDFSGVVDDFAEPTRESKRKAMQQIKVQTISLNDLLEKYNAPFLTYLSLDTEGSELRILKEFDFARWSPRLISVEHNSRYREDNNAYLNSIISFMEKMNYEGDVVKQDILFRPNDKP